MQRAKVGCLILSYSMRILLPPWGVIMKAEGSNVGKRHSTEPAVAEVLSQCVFPLSLPPSDSESSGLSAAAHLIYLEAEVMLKPSP